MSIFSWFSRKEEEPSFDLMDNSQKKKFLSNDLIERMIRIEQRVSSHVGKPIHYRSTQYYKSLSDNQRKSFESHLRHKKKKVYLFSSLAISSLLGLGAITGNAVVDVASEGPQWSYLSVSLISILLICAIFLVFYEKRKRHNRLSSVYDMIGSTLR